MHELHWGVCAEGGLVDTIYTPNLFLTLCFHRCSTEAPATLQFTYVAILLMLTAFVQTWSELGPAIIPYKNEKRGNYIRVTVVPKMMGPRLGARQCVQGSAFLLHRIGSARPWPM